MLDFYSVAFVVIFHYVMSSQDYFHLKEPLYLGISLHQITEIGPILPECRILALRSDALGGVATAG